MTSKGGTRPWLIEAVYLFDAKELLGVLKKRGVKIGVATSVAKCLWAEAEIYPHQQNRQLMLNDNQRKLLGSF
jgi:hypothetical protein